jgi:Secretion system C-terminal sorting domain
MKKILLFLFIASPFWGFSQVTADPSLDPMKITTTGNGTILVTELPLNGIVKLKVPILNRNTSNALPIGTCKVKVNLGSKLILDPLFNLNTVNTSNYFSWTAVASGGTVQITGDLIAQLPANFSDTAYFDVKGTILGISTITTNFLVTNHNTNTTLSDENGNNNTASTLYAIVAGVVPVTFTNVFTEKKDCALKVICNVENEINVDRYELEISKDFNNFEKISTLKANNLNRYTFSLEIPQQYQAPIVLVRIKSIDLDGKFQYSEIRKLSGICNSEEGLSVYPNPVPKNVSSFYIEKSNGVFNGIYAISILDMTGKLIKNTEVKLANVNRFNYNMGTVSAGQYLIKIFNSRTNSLNILKVIKQ